MPPLIRVEALEQSRAGVAECVHAVQMAAYTQEAELIEAVGFPPLERTVEQVRSSNEQVWGALAGNTLVGVIAIELNGEGSPSVSSLVVAPAWQRRGIARELLLHVLRRFGSSELQVQTAARNTPALSLYLSCGFAVIRKWVVGSPELELVRLARPPGAAQNVA